MNLFDKIKRDVVFTSRLLKLLGRVNTVSPAVHRLACDDFEAVADHHAHDPAIIFEGRTLSYIQLDQMANRYAHWAREQHLKPGEVVAVLLPNRMEYFPIWIGLNKVGVVSALINNSLSGAGLAHCLNISGAGHVIVDGSTHAGYEAIQDQLSRTHQLWALDLEEVRETKSCRAMDRAIRGQSLVRPDRAIRADLTAHATALLIYTSGTTGLPKAAKITNARVQLYMQAFAAVSDMRAGDRLYNPLPLYHATGGLCGLGAPLLNGGTLILKRRFSASSYWADVKASGATHLIYIGELCRYLTNAPETDDPTLETGHKVRLAFGNGLRPEVWTHFQKRFNIPRIVEFYGSTEGNVSLFNLDGRPGAIGRVPSFLKKKVNIRLVQFDTENELPVRAASGLCLEVRPGLVGEAIGEIAGDARHAYSGYADSKASEKKILRDVFKRGDAYFRTGDLMRMDRDGYFYFVDRIGDTFRFKGENVSTSEVAEYAASAPGIEDVVAYGVTVPHFDGKAGMIAIRTREGFDMAALYRHLNDNLPDFAVPRFVRRLSEVETTSTFKYKKTDLVAEGFDPALGRDPLFVLNNGGYVPLTKTHLADIRAGRLRF